MHFIPPIYKERLIVIKKIRIVFNIGIFLILSLIAIFFSMVALYKYIDIKSNAVKGNMEAVRNSISYYNSIGVNNEMSSLDKDIRNVIKFMDSQIYIKDIYNLLSDVVKGKASLDMISINKLDAQKEGYEYQVSISGTSPSESEFSAIKNELSSYSYIDNVITDINSYFHTDNFTINFKFLKYDKRKK